MEQSALPARLAADLIVVFHAGFVAFVMLGGLLLLRWPRIAWVHVPAVVWGAAVEFTGWICPLTPLENYFREQSGAAYRGDFIERYVVSTLYPSGLTRELQLFLGAFALVVNAVVYWNVLRSARRRRALERPREP
ncbi:MAG TPA: DUF2784 domain-containing protein [Vicinamibacterales bacterium]